MRDYGADTQALNARAHQHEHKFHSQREHRAAHKAADREARRTTIRRAARTVTRSEWLDRSPGERIAVRKRGGARYGPAPRIRTALDLAAKA